MKVMLELTPEAFSSLEETVLIQSLADSARTLIEEIDRFLSKESIRQHEVRDLQDDMIYLECFKRVLEYYTSDEQRKTEFVDIFEGGNDE